MAECEQHFDGKEMEGVDQHLYKAKQRLEENVKSIRDTFVQLGDKIIG